MRADGCPTVRTPCRSSPTSPSAPCATSSRCAACAFSRADIASQIAVVEAQLADPNLWFKDPAGAQRLSRQHHELTGRHSLLGDLDELAELEAIAAADPSLIDELALLVAAAADRIDELVPRRAATPYDDHDAVLTVTAGAGGNEAQWFCDRLSTMYSAWGQKAGYEVDVDTDEAPGGLRCASITLRGVGAYGRVRVEAGVHRLSRVSDFDSAGRRHTSFAAVEVLPVLQDDEVELAVVDVRVDTFRGSGPGGQHRNVTDSAVRVTHLPSGLTASVTSGRSQADNRRAAMEVLRGRLADRMLADRQADLDAARGQRPDASFGGRIRSYVMSPYTLVVDHRSNYRRGDVDAVLAGDLDDFLDAEHARRAQDAPGA